MIISKNSLGKFFIENKEYILLIVIVFLALLTFFSIMGISFKDKNDQNIYLKKQFTVETFDNEFKKYIDNRVKKLNSGKSSKENSKYNKTYEHPSNMNCEKDPEKCHEHCTQQINSEDCTKHSHCGWGHSWSHKHQAFHGHCGLHDITTKTVCEQPNYSSEDNELCYYKRGDHAGKKKSCYPDKQNSKKFANERGLDHNTPYHFKDSRHPNYQKINEDGDYTT